MFKERIYAASLRFETHYTVKYKGHPAGVVHPAWAPALRSFSSLISSSSALPLEEKTVILLNSSLGMENRVENLNSESKTEDEDLQEASFGFFGNTGEKEEDKVEKKVDEFEDNLLVFFGGAKASEADAFG